ncbi:hypothetical protein BJP25_23295 [Actinokineospora bangkokensis]|uniref:ParB-like N-terminal domain-containing protein n=1 Tax=Actinokineospora bangkokensis TaxID=1193682 RepID=A0A1Q9LK03_9PSEU|nr:hypothetical protein BJP25_23295 [Actinokineospora bangkokensis]
MAEEGTRVAIAALAYDRSPRRAGLDDGHVRALAEVLPALPPILVHRQTMRVLDGVHRLRAAQLRGATDIAVLFFDGDEAAAFVQSVRANVEHGLPLTLADRTAAAARILRSFPEWSDRRVAAATGLSPKTAGAVRARSSAEIPQSTGRVGRDGRTRRVPARPAPAPEPVAPAAEERPVRVRGAQRAADAGTANRPLDLQRLRRDPSLRFSECGRALLRLLDLHSITPATWKRIADNTPAHCATAVADIARDCAEAWAQFADHLDERTA